MQDDGPTSDGSPQGGATGSRGTAGRLGLVGVGAAAVAGYAWWAVGLTSFSVEASIAVLAAGGAAALVGTRRRRTAPVSGDAWGLVAWGVVVATGAALQLSAYLQHPREDHPTLSSLTNALLDSHPARAAAFVVWLAATVELARR